VIVKLCYKKMSIYRIDLDKEVFLKIPEDERNLFVAIAHLQNEISFSINGVAWSRFNDLTNNDEMKGQIVLNLYYLKILSGKLHEGWQLLNKHFFSNKKISCYFNENSSPKGLTSLKNIKNYFSKNNAISNIRNKLSFHYNPSDITRHLEKINDPLSLYMSDENLSNTIYYFAEVLSSWAALSEFDNFLEDNPLKVINKELIEISTEFSVFNNHFLKVIINKYKPEIWEDKGSKIEIHGLKHFKEARIPAFIDTSKGYT
jgi:hypothetical protein